MKRKTYQTLWELESIYIRACRVAGINPDIESYKGFDDKQTIVILKRKIVKTILDI
tara:strand:+ start:365 stop:532 length:168 start_codon:yes stop_codon:yes gene_type:complete